MSGNEPAQNLPPPLLRGYAEYLNQGAVLAFPTETYYGLLARLDRPEALARIFTLKGRPEGKPLPVIAADKDRACALWSKVDELAHKLIAEFWPGPLTIVLPASAIVPDRVTAATGKVGVRVPGSAAARGLAALAGGALAATSANPGNQPPAMSPAEVRAYFGDAVVIAEGPKLPPSRGSTVLDLSVRPPALLREGDVGREVLEIVLGSLLRADK